MKVIVELNQDDFSNSNSIGYLYTSGERTDFQSHLRHTPFQQKAEIYSNKAKLDFDLFYVSGWFYKIIPVD